MKKDLLSRPAFRVALSGIVAALGVALMLLTSLIPFGTYAFPCAAGALLVIIVIELNAKWALGVYAAVSLLSFFLAGDKEAVVYYILLLGYYPMLKNLIESKVRTKPMRLLFKFAVFNAAAVASTPIPKTSSRERRATGRNGSSKRTTNRFSPYRAISSRAEWATAAAAFCVCSSERLSRSRAYSFAASIRLNPLPPPPAG